MAKPRAILVGGAPGVGKTTLARALANHLGWTWISGDDLATAARAMASPRERPELHPMAPIGYTRYFTETEPERQIEDAVALAEAMWPAFRQVVRNRAAGDDPVVIDWWLFSPATLADLVHDGVASIWLHIEPAVLWERERRNHCFWADSAQPDQMLANFMHRSLWRNEMIKDQAGALGLPLVYQPGDRTVEQLVQAALDAIGLS